MVSVAMLSCLPAKQEQTAMPYLVCLAPRHQS